MPWITISANHEELERRELTAAVSVGRSSECDVTVRDILLSRTHCRIEPATGDGAPSGAWRVIDLNSKNGTRVGWQGVQSHVLRDGDHLRLGRTRIVFHTSPFEPAPQRPPRADRLVRPADPHEALSGTVTDFVLVDEHDDPADSIHFSSDRPYPQPRPLEPESYAAPEVASLLEQLAFGRDHRAAADNGAGLAVTQTRTVARALPRVKPIYREIRQRSTEPDLSLQVDTAAVAAALPEALPTPTRRRRFLAAAGWTVAAAFATAIAVGSAWLLTLAP
jgi:hypothetical protein